MHGKIGLEEHFAIADTLMDSAGFVPDDHWAELRARLLDTNDRRLAEMDRHGMEMMILSLNAPAIQAVPDTVRAVELSCRANDALAEVVAAARTPPHSARCWKSSPGSSGSVE